MALKIEGILTVKQMGVHGLNFNGGLGFTSWTKTFRSSDQIGVAAASFRKEKPWA